MLTNFKTLAENWAIKKNQTLPNKKNSVTLTMCKECYTFRYGKLWRFERPELLKSSREPVLAVKFTQCPTCIEQENATHELESDLIWSRG